MIFAGKLKNNLFAGNTKYFQTRECVSETFVIPVKIFYEFSNFTPDSRIAAFII